MKAKRGKKALRKTRAKYIAIVMAAAAAMLSAGFSIQGTLAWLNHSDSRNNRVGIMQYIFSQRIQEEFTPPAPGTSLIGGEEVDKKSWVTNNGDIPAFVRVKVFPVLTSKPDPLQPGKLLYFEAQFGKQLEFVGLNTTDWMDGGDGWYYYLHVLPPDDGVTQLHRTAPLFEKVKLDTDVVTYASAELTVTLIAETVEPRKYVVAETTKYHYRDAWWDNNAGVGSRSAVGIILDPLATG